MTTATARKTENDGRQFYAVTLGEETLTVGVTEDGALIDGEGFPLDESPARVEAIRAALAAA